LLANEADRGGRDAGALDVAGEGADGARAERSNGNEERHVDAVLGEESAHLGAGLFEHLGRGAPP